MAESEVRGMSKTYIYIRVSDKEDDGRGQVAACLRAAGVEERHSLEEKEIKKGGFFWPIEETKYSEIVLAVERPGAKGDDDRRPVLGELRKRLKAGDVLITTELSRLTRRVVTALLLLEELTAKGVVVKVLREGIDYSTPIGRAIATVIAAFAELEHGRIKERIRDGVRRAREGGTRSGKPIGRPRKNMCLDEARAMRAGGQSWREIAAKMGVGETTLRYAVKGEK